MRPRIVTLDGIYQLNRDGFYEPEREEEETRLSWRYLLFYGWPLVVGVAAAAITVWRHFAG
ncbi:hypothetical protein LB553_00980 [Mesorhizobium sp. CA8]|uniref:hypothetical protein n=1 Tax=Mesorhizobium sp. CA8 TaxID=2876637 RepID=UPI001CCA2163|nr:hypothetical protein [Mesorhizobium sp. CA8]MBZ9759461.1 hypothetical protein [Mesorhizobium sp. CA8]